MMRLLYFCAMTGARPSALGVASVSRGCVPATATHDHAIARGETRGHDPGFAVPVAELDRPGLGLALRVDDVDELAFGAFEHRALRHQDRGRPLGAF